MSSRGEGEQTQGAAGVAFKCGSYNSVVSDLDFSISGPVCGANTVSVPDKVLSRELQRQARSWEGREQSRARQGCGKQLTQQWVGLNAGNFFNITCCCLRQVQLNKGERQASHQTVGAVSKRMCSDCK